MPINPTYTQQQNMVMHVCTVGAIPWKLNKCADGGSKNGTINNIIIEGKISDSFVLNV